MTLLNSLGMAAVAALLSAATTAAELSFDLQKELQSAPPGKSVAVIILYQSEADPALLRRTLRHQKRAIRRDVVPRTLKQQAYAVGNRIASVIVAAGGDNTRILWIISAVAANVPADVIDQLRQDPEVLGIRLDQVLESPFPMAGSAAFPEWNIAVVAAPELWRLGYLGGSVVVATMDTGVDGQHPDLTAGFRGGNNSWFDPYGQHATPYDRTGHGTQVMGIIAGGELGGSAIGVAPQAKWIAAKIFNDAGTATESAIHASYQWLLDPDGDPQTDDAPDVVNNSWSFSSAGVCDTTFQADIDALKAADIAMVFSAGNFGPAAGSGVSPANNPGALSIGALDAEGLVASFSSRGPSTCDDSLLPDLVAPGDGVQTTDLSFGGNPYYVAVSGTSFAAPHVAGVLALLRDAAPPAGVDELESAIIGSAIDAAIPGPDQETGYGLVNAVAALEVLAYPIDLDGDGYGPVIDCDDTDASVYPGAAEHSRDGIDQDCNGFDLTIKVHQAVYSHDGTSLLLRASSRYGAQAALEVVGVGPLEYRAHRKDWYMNGGSADGYEHPSVIVRGTEGEVSVTPRKPTPRR
jgi:serine protease AprX